MSVDESYELNDSGCYRVRRLEENLYQNYLPANYTGQDIITYQWNQDREDNYQGQFNFYYTLKKNSVSKSSMCLYMVLLLAIGVVGDLLATLVQKMLEALI